jgi:hypothetical protein
MAGWMCEERFADFAAALRDFMSGINDDGWLCKYLKKELGLLDSA